MKAPADWHDVTLSEPTVFENYVHDLYVDDQAVELSLWDTAGAYCPDDRVERV
jgi:GTPase SAR1 family protein